MLTKMKLISVKSSEICYKLAKLTYNLEIYCCRQMEIKKLRTCISNLVDDFYNRYIFVEYYNKTKKDVLMAEENVFLYDVNHLFCREDRLFLRIGC